MLEQECGGGDILVCGDVVDATRNGYTWSMVNGDLHVVCVRYQFQGIGTFVDNLQNISCRVQKPEEPEVVKILEISKKEIYLINSQE